MSDEIPEGWVETTIGACLEFRYGKGLPEKHRSPGDVPVFGSNGVVGKHNESVTSGPTIIVGRKGSVGEVHLCRSPCWPIDTTYFIESFGPFEPRLLVHLLRSLDLSQQESSTAIPGLSRDDAYARVLLVPPLSEQRRIALKVDVVFEQVRRASERLARLPSILKRFRQAVLAAACTGELTRDWREANGRSADWALSTVEGASDRTVDCPHSTPKWTDKGEICLRTTNFFVRGLDLAEVRYVSPATYTERVSRLVPEPGDVVYSREGGILGIACVLPKGLRACLGQRMMLMRPKSSLMRPEFLCAVLNSPAINAKVRELTGGTASPHLNVGDIKKFEVPLPGLDEQDVILAKLRSLFTLADTIENRVQAAVVRAEKLPQAILSKAFAGELVPTEAELARAEGRSYETAEELLKRVTSILPAASTDKARRRRTRSA